MKTPYLKEIEFQFNYWNSDKFKKLVEIIS